ncbi:MULTISPECIES: DUF1707 domain-containing protein [unclassified Nocardiopsis]|uniref:DUF1707 domain-containing protein n=1 Tax=unclassified Nocardiopsis TaxID=2649073 RepID=UPI00066B6D23|nr:MULTISPECIES: DUF1707 domain-containing protein [unclassified Nocardiopsis]MBQ1080334.1 DUF1707 domain-containing protein [Nocardiopsis sp. B62]
MSEPVPSIRTSDSERDRVAGLLQEHFAQGRLDHEEFTERLSQAYRSRTVEELAVVTRDLPERDLADVGRAPLADAAAPPLRLRDPALMVPWVLYGGVNVLCFFIWLILYFTTGASYPWFLWVLGPWGIMMSVVTFGVLAAQRGQGED